MSRAVNLFTPQQSQPNTHNTDGFPAYDRSLQETYLQLIMTNTFGNTFYQSVEKVMERSEELHRKILSEDIGFMAKALVYARLKGYMRLQPILGLYQLTTHPDYWDHDVFNKIIRTPNDLRDFMVITKSHRKGEGGRRIKKLVQNWFDYYFNIHSFDRIPYWTLKYGSDKKGGYSMADIIKTCHVRPTPAAELHFKYLVQGDHAFQDLGKNFPRWFEGTMHSFTPIEAYEYFKKNPLKEGMDEFIRSWRFPPEIVTPFIGTDSRMWKALAKGMPVFALLKNLATLERHNAVDCEAIEAKLLNDDVLAKSMILPFRFLDAHEKVNSNYLKDVCKAALVKTLGNIPPVLGISAVFLDRSGSMTTNRLSTAALMAAGIMKQTNYKSKFYIFDDRLEEVSFSFQDSIITQIQGITPRGGTATHLTIQELYDKRIIVDNIILFTDEQQNTGHPFINQFVRYRDSLKYWQKRNKGVKLFIVNVASEKGHLMPETKDVYYLYGLSDKILNFISLKTQGIDILSQLQTAQDIVEDE